MIVIAERREEIQVKFLFERDSYKNMNREEMWNKAIEDGWVFSNIRGRFRKVVKL